MLFTCVHENLSFKSNNNVQIFTYNVDRCDLPLGIRDGRVTRAMFSASSMYNHLYGPWSARLQAQNRGSMRGGWIAKYNNRHQFLQVDLGTTSRVKRIATQARYDANQWVKSYTVSYSNNGVRFFPYRHGKRVKVRCLHCLFFRSSEALTTRKIMTEIFQRILIAFDRVTIIAARWINKSLCASAVQAVTRH